MKEIKKLSDNPTGQILRIASIDDFVKNILANIEGQVSSIPWWKFWSLGDWHKAIGFFIVSMDELITRIAQEKIPGADKKATVLAALGTAYDVLIVTAAPFWMKPFVIAAKGLILNTLCSMLIDWIVDKYKNGSWRKYEETTQDAQTQV